MTMHGATGRTQATILVSHTLWRRDGGADITPRFLPRGLSRQISGAIRDRAAKRGGIHVSREARTARVRGRTGIRGITTTTAYDDGTEVNVAHTDPLNRGGSTHSPSVSAEFRGHPLGPDSSHAEAPATVVWRGLHCVARIPIRALGANSAVEQRLDSVGLTGPL